MNKLLFIFCVITLFSCGSKKKFNKVDSVENIKSTEQLYAKLYRDTRLLEFLDIKYRKVETRDSAGNERIETDRGKQSGHDKNCKFPAGERGESGGSRIGRRAIWGDGVLGVDNGGCCCYYHCVSGRYLCDKKVEGG